MFSARQIIKGLYSQGYTIFISRRGQLGVKLNEHFPDAATLLQRYSDLPTEKVSEIMNTQLKQIHTLIDSHGNELAAYLQSQPTMCGAGPHGHDASCFTGATHIATRRYLRQVVNGTIELRMQEWYFCETHLPDQRKLVDLHAKLTKLV